MNRRPNKSLRTGLSLLIVLTLATVVSAQGLQEDAKFMAIEKDGAKMWQGGGSLLSLLSCMVGSVEAELLTIGQLTKYGASYHLHSVSIVGTVRAMQVLPPLPAFGLDRCSPLYGVAYFELTDDTGSLPVETLGSCHPAAAAELPHDGDVIELTAQIQVFVPDGHPGQIIKAVTQKIVLLKPASSESSVR